MDKRTRVKTKPADLSLRHLESFILMLQVFRLTIGRSNRPVGQKKVFLEKLKSFNLN